MKTFLLLINLSNPVDQADLKNWALTDPAFQGWKGKICVNVTCESFDRTLEDPRLVPRKAYENVVASFKKLGVTGELKSEHRNNYADIAVKISIEETQYEQL